MKKSFASLFIVAALGSSLFTVGCTHEVAHTEKTTPTMTGGTKHEETSVYRNPDGSTTTERNSSRSNP